MARFLTTIPNNLGFYNLGTVESYPTGGAGPTAYGPTTYFGSDPLPARGGDNLSDPIDLGSFDYIDCFGVLHHTSDPLKSLIQLEYKYDPKLIGGLIIQVGSVMIDTSIKTKLKQLENKMIGA